MSSRCGESGAPSRKWRISSSLALVCCLILLPGRPARAEHGEIDLKVIAPEREHGPQDEEVSVSAKSDEEPPVGGAMKPPVLEVKPGEPLVLQFIMTNLYPHGILKNMTVRYYVVETDRLGKKPRPELKSNEGVVTRGEFTVNFKPKCRVGARLQFRVPKPGLYIVRVETDSHGDREHEHFSAIDLKAE